MKKRVIGAVVIILGLVQSPLLGESLTLKESIDMAKKNSESIAISKAKVDAADALAGQALGLLLPQLSVDARVGRFHVEQPAFYVKQDTFFPGIPPEDSEYDFEIPEFDASYVNGDFKQSIFAWGQLWWTWEVARLGADIAREDLKSAVIDLEYNVISAYYGVIKARKAHELSLEYLGLAQSHFLQANGMYKSGVVTRADILRAQLEVARAELMVSKARSAVAIAENFFNLATGRDLGTPVDLNEKDFRIGAVSEPDFEEYLIVAYKNRPDWKSVKLAEKIADKNKWISWGGFLPVFFAAAQTSHTYMRYVETGSEQILKNWTAVIAASWTLFDGLATPNKVKEAYAKYTEADKGKQLLLKKVQIEVKDACLNLSSAVDEMSAAKKAFELAEENNEIADKRYSSGVATNIEAIDAKTLLTSAKLDYLEAEFNYELAKASLDKAVGREMFTEETATIEAEVDTVTLAGVVKYVPVEGGFVGFVSDAGDNYEIMGEMAREISGRIGKSEKGRRIIIIGKAKEDIYTSQMWGIPLEVTSYKWE